MSPSTTRERILEAAARLFHEQGYASTGVATILREAGVNSGSLYHYFPSKEALLVGVLDRYVGLLEPEVMSHARARSEDAIERIFALLQGYREMLVMTNCSLGCPIGNLALETSDSYPEAREKVALNFANWCKVVQSWLNEAGDRLPADLDRERLSRFVLTVMEGGIMQARAHKSLEHYDASIAQLRDYFDRLLTEARARRGHEP